MLHEELGMIIRALAWLTQTVLLLIFAPKFSKMGSCTRSSWATKAAMAIMARRPLFSLQSKIGGVNAG